MSRSSVVAPRTRLCKSFGLVLGVYGGCVGERALKLVWAQLCATLEDEAFT